MREQSLLVKEHMWRWVSGLKFSRKGSEDTRGHSWKGNGVSRGWEIIKVCSYIKKTREANK